MIVALHFRLGQSLVITTLQDCKDISNLATLVCGLSEHLCPHSAYIAIDYHKIFFPENCADKKVEETKMPTLLAVIILVMREFRE